MPLNNCISQFQNGQILEMNNLSLPFNVELETKLIVKMSYTVKVCDINKSVGENLVLEKPKSSYFI